MATTRRIALAAFTTSFFGRAKAEDSDYLLVNAPYPPFVLGAGHPRGEGLDVDIAREALALAGSKRGVRLLVVPWRRALGMLERGEAHFTTTISLSEDRDRYLWFTEGYRQSTRYVVFSRKGTPVRVERLEDLGRYHVGFSAGFFYPPALRRGPGRSSDGVDLVGTFKMLDAGRTDVAVVNAVAGGWTLLQLGLQDRLERQPFSFTSGSPTYMATSKARDREGELASLLNRGLALMRKQGRLESLEKSWVGELN